jgi:NADH dehydrogenase/NADH:ubiquinone oxidoreductase subunit G
MNSNVETCVINTDIADSGLFELGCDLGSKEDFKSLDLNIDIGSDISNSVKDIAKFNIFIGSHGNSSLLNYDVILPSNTFFEKDSFFMNFNGKVQKTSKVSKLLPETRSEESILENLMIYLTSQNSEMFFSESSKFDSLDKLTCYSLSENNGLKGVNLHHKTRNSVEKLNNFSSTIDNYYLSNSISSSSKVMQECSLINTKLKNF